MKRLAFATLTVVLVLSGCTLPGLPGASPNSRATAAAIAFTEAALTSAAEPTATLPPSPTLPPTDVPTQTATSTLPPFPTMEASATPTVGTPATSSPTQASSTGTATASLTLTPAATYGAGTASPTAPLIPREYGTQPPAIPYGRVHLINHANRPVYVSFQCVAPDGTASITETPVGGRTNLSIAIGQCHWVAWVGSKEFSGDIRLQRFEELTFTFTKTRVMIQ